jgi:AcrR family transcriptional regulator
MGRIKTISDDAVLDALLRGMEASGPDGLSFSKASAVVGLSPATLVQRFGTRDVMIRAVLLHAWDRLDALTIAADEEAPPTPAGAIALLLRLMPGGTAEYNVTGGLLLLREDLRDPVLRARGHAWGSYLAKALSRRLASGAGSAEQVGWQMLALWQGAIIWWAFKRDSDPEDEIRTALEQWWLSVGGDKPATDHPRRPA